MSVVESVQLPGNPSTGNLVFEGLGGDGIIAPASAFFCNHFQITGDGTGGFAEMEICTDPRFDCLVAMCATEAAGGSISSEQPVLMEVEWDSGFSYGIVLTGGYMSSDAVSRANFSPDPIFEATKLRARWNNLNGATYSLSTIIYNFKKGVAQQSPLNLLVASLPRSASALP